MYTRSVLTLLCLVGVGCGGAQAHGGNAKASTSNDGESATANGLTVSRPAGWTFIAPDNSVAPDTLILLQGPAGDDAVAPVVEISRRQLKAADQRRKPAHILTTMVTEIAQTFDGFEGVTSPEDMQLSGHAAARINLRYTESLPDGTSVQRAARFYGIVQGEQIWIVRCIGPTDASADEAFDSVIRALRLE